MTTWITAFHVVNTIAIVTLAAAAACLFALNQKGMGSRAMRTMALFLALRAIVNLPTPIQLFWPADVAFWNYAKVYFLLPLPLVVLYFALVYPASVIRRRTAWAFVLAGISLVLWFAIDHTAYATIRSAPTRDAAHVAYGPLFHAVGLLYIMYVAVGWWFARQWRRGHGMATASLGLLSAGFALNGVYLFAVEAGWALTSSGDKYGMLRVAGMLPVIPFAILLARECWLAWGAGRRGAAAYVVGLGVAVAAAAIEVTVTASGIAPVLGVTDAGWLLLQPLLLAYALLRHQLFGIDLGVKWTLRQGTTATAAATLLLTTEALGGRWLPPGPAAAANVAAIVLLVLTMTRLQKLATQLADAALPGVADTPAYLRARRLEILRAAGLDEAPAGGPGQWVRGVKVLGRYVIESSIGDGSQGRTYVARDEELDRLVVVKVAAGDGPDLLREARAMAKVRHPNVVGIIDAQAMGQSTIIVMAYAAGGSLADRLRKDALAWPEVQKMAEDVGAGLDAIHAAGLIHRDVKPANILYDGVRWQIADFGVATTIGRSTLGRGHIVGHAGSVPYMSPEQIRGAPLTGASDWWALGVVIHEALCRRLPFDVLGLPAFDARMAILDDEPRITVSRPAAAVALIEALLDKDAGLRARVNATVLRQPRDGDATPGLRDFK